MVIGASIKPFLPIHRQGIPYDTPSKNGKSNRRTSVVNFSSTPGHKRQNLKIDVPSLAQPSITPRINRSTLIRLSSAAASPRTGTGQTVGEKTHVPLKEGAASPNPLGQASPRKSHFNSIPPSNVSSTPSRDNNNKSTGKISNGTLSPTKPRVRMSTIGGNRMSVDFNQLGSISTSPRKRDENMDISRRQNSGSGGLNCGREEEVGDDTGDIKSTRRRTMVLPSSLDEPSIVSCFALSSLDHSESKNTSKKKTDVPLSLC